MFKILDRYLIREIVLPFAIGLVVLSFVLEIPVILQQGEPLIEKGVAWSVVLRVLLTLLPQALSITIPMALLLGILIGLGRLSADREFVAMHACGVSLFRLLRPVALLALLACAATAYETIVALPGANQTFREITFGVVATSAERDVKAGVFFDKFPDRVLYVRDQPAGGGWRDVFLAETRADRTTVYFAKEGRLLIDREKRLVQLQLMNGTSHMTRTDRPDEYQGTDFDSTVLSLDPETVFPRVTLMKGENEMTVAELRQSIAEAARRGEPPYRQLFTIQQKFALPVACLVLAVIGLALGVSSRKDGKLASFVLGIGVIFVYYVLLFSSRGLALGGRLSPTWAPWLANIVLGAVGVMLVLWRAGGARDRSIRFSIPAFRRRADGAAAGGDARTAAPKPPPRVRVATGSPHLNLPRPRLLDVYVARQYLGIFFLTVFALLGIFYISTFIDLADKLFRGAATTRMVLSFMYFKTPQYVYYVIPIGVLVSTLVTIGVMTKNSELVVIKACGISLYRVAAPLVLFALVASASLFTLQERVLASFMREADRLERAMRGFPPLSMGWLDRRWIVANNGDIYHYEVFDPGANRFTRFSIFHLDDRAWRLASLTYAKEVVLRRQPGADGQPMLAWQATQGWTRDLTVTRRRGGVANEAAYSSFGERPVSLEAPDYFKTEEPQADQMTYGQLSRYIAQLKVSGFNVVPAMVELQHKLAFPFVTLVMTLLAVPFAVTTGRRGALYGIGAGIVLAIVYWITLSVFKALGAGGVLAPALAAWAPNVLFGAAAAYMILTVRT